MNSGRCSAPGSCGPSRARCRSASSPRAASPRSSAALPTTLDPRRLGRLRRRRSGPGSTPSTPRDGGRLPAARTTSGRPVTSWPAARRSPSSRRPPRRRLPTRRTRPDRPPNRGGAGEGRPWRPNPPVDDAGFFRRLWLDTIGVPPTAEEVEAFLADTRPDKRSRAVDDRLADPRWADDWMGYWQDVLAENPGILKPTLNNTGPFRRFLHRGLPRQHAVRPVRHRADPDGGERSRRRPGRVRHGDAERRPDGRQGPRPGQGVPRRRDEVRPLPRRPVPPLRAGATSSAWPACSRASRRRSRPPAPSAAGRGPRAGRLGHAARRRHGRAAAWNLTDIAPDELPEGLLPEAAVAPRPAGGADHVARATRGSPR